ncbi:MAG TPA: pseudouridine synthase [Vicinamibacterales bacterium]|nr:pseudouridine synthase [Vicinamibacterales bacterium]
MPIRLQKILSSAGLASRRSAEALIAQGRVSVNGVTTTEPGSRADPDVDDIRVDGRRVTLPHRRRYLLLNKPRGYITSRSDPQRRPTVIDLLRERGIDEYVYPVGRLDYDSEGLLLLTSDGDLAARLTHPRHGVEREYDVQVRGVPDRRIVERLARGIVIDGRRTAPAQVTLRKTYEGPGGTGATLSLVIHEGRNRQVRKMCDAVGLPVVRLRRVRIGPVRDASLRPGDVRDLSAREIAALRKAADLTVSPTGALPRTAPAPRSRRRSAADRPRRG